MSQATGQPNANESIVAWADVVVKMWRDRIMQLNVWDYGFLYDSFVNHVIRQAGGDTQKIDFLFKQYGIWQDMGVGKETKRGNPGDLGAVARVVGPNGRSRIARQPKHWYSGVFFREVMKLREYLAFWYGYQSALIVSEAFSPEIFDQRFKGARKNTATVGSLRTLSYRERNNARWRKNYHEFGFSAWKSRNKR